MKTWTLSVGMLTLLASTAFAQDVTKASGNIPVVDYKYGMHLDIVKVISSTDTSHEEGIVPVTLKYADSNGAVHKLRFLEDAEGSTSRDE